MRQRHDLVEQHVAAPRCGYIEYVIGPAGLRLEIRFLVKLRDRHVEISVLQIATRRAVVQRRLLLSGGGAVGAVKDPHRRESLILFVAAVLCDVPGDGQGAPVGRRRRLDLRIDTGDRLRITGCTIDVAELAQRRQHVLMAVAIRLALNHQDTLLQRGGVRVLPVLQVQLGEGRQRGHEVRMVAAQRDLLHCKRARVIPRRLLILAGLCGEIPQATEQSDDILPPLRLGKLQHAVALIERLLNLIGRPGGLESLGGPQQIGGLSQRQRGKQRCEQGRRELPRPQVAWGPPPDGTGRRPAFVAGRDVTRRGRHGVRVKNPQFGASSFLYAGGICTVPEDSPVREVLRAPVYNEFSPNGQWHRQRTCAPRRAASLRAASLRALPQRPPCVRLMPPAGAFLKCTA